ncbi:MAG: hypothetical protein ACRDTH_28710 [Pseudonocardiaceae bacterium]
MASTVGCPARHPIPTRGGRICPACRRDQVIAQVRAVETSLSEQDVVAAVDAVATSHAVWRSLAAALASDPDVLARGAPPVVGRLVTELIARGSTTWAAPRCVVCGRTGAALTVTDRGGMCKRCAARRDPRACTHCGVVKPVVGRTGDGKPFCEACRRHRRGHRRCGACGTTASIAVRARDGEPDICVTCYRLPAAVCHVCRRLRPCTFATSEEPICRRCAPRTRALCARCGHDRPPAVRWDEGPLCDPCYTAALRHRGRCAVCGHERRLVAPPGPEATTCADCTATPGTHACGVCGLEDKLYEKGRCARCSLARRTAELLSCGTGNVPTELTAVFEAICAARTPRSALNWLRKGTGASILADLAAGRLAATHDALDGHPRRRGADYLRQMLIAGGVLPPRDEELARIEQWLADLLASLTTPEHRRLVHTFATWRVMRRLRRSAEANSTPRTYTAHARLKIKTAVSFLTWLAARDTTLSDCRQADIDDWLTTSPAACHVRDFLAWAAERGYCHQFPVPSPERHTGTATDPDHRWALISRLLHDDGLDTVDRVAGALVLLFGQQQSRIAAMTTDHIIHRDDDEVSVRFGRHDVPVPPPLGALLLQLIHHGKSHVGVGSPPDSRWLFPGGLPGRPITASRLADRLRKLGIHTQAGRRAALLDLAIQLPAAVLADLLNLHTTTAVKWTHQAGGDWTRYAAEIARTRNHQPCEYP